MNGLMKRNNMMTSLEIAEVTGKQHKDVMKAIRNMEEAWVNVQGRKFALSSRIYDLPNGGRKEIPCYSLTKIECLYIATKFNDDARAKLVLRWEQLEKERIMQGAVRHLLVNDSDVMTEAERIVGVKLEGRNQKAEDCLTASEIAERLGIDTKDLNSFLCDMGIQKWNGGKYHLTPKYQGQGLTKERLFIYYSKSGKKRERTYLVWTPAGKEFILKKAGVIH